jgi:hypothetical protein
MVGWREFYKERPMMAQERSVVGVQFFSTQLAKGISFASESIKCDRPPK